MLHGQQSFVESRKQYLVQRGGDALGSSGLVIIPPSRPTKTICMLIALIGSSPILVGDPLVYLGEWNVQKKKTFRGKLEMRIVSDCQNVRLGGAGDGVL